MFVGDYCREQSPFVRIVCMREREREKERRDVKVGRNTKEYLLGDKRFSQGLKLRSITKSKLVNIEKIEY